MVGAGAGMVFGSGLEGGGVVAATFGVSTGFDLVTGAGVGAAFGSGFGAAATFGAVGAGVGVGVGAGTTFGATGMGSIRA